MSEIVVRGARMHNLKSVDVDIPRGKLVVVTGPSGSGKSSLAIDTVYAEGQRRYVESLSPYARQFLGQLPKPDVDSIDGLSPSICIEQEGGTRNPRSTVGTVTEIHDYLRLLFARAGSPHCPNCGKRIDAQTVAQMSDRILELPEGTRLTVLAPAIRNKKGEHKKELTRFRKDGFVRATVDGEVMDLGGEIELDRNKAHNIDVHVDRLVARPDIRQRASESIELALTIAEGLVKLEIAGGETLLLSEKFACVDCGISLPELSPRLFSFNSPEGACSQCGGLGERTFFSEDLIVPDRKKSLENGAILPWGSPGNAYFDHWMLALSKMSNVRRDVPFESLSAALQKAILYGDAKLHFDGVIPSLEKARERLRGDSQSSTESSDGIEEDLTRFLKHEICSSCGGTRLRKEALAVKIGDRTIAQLCSLSIAAARTFFCALVLGSRESTIGARVLHEIESRLRFLNDVGLAYLSLDRAAATLSGGESQRIRLATQVGSGLSGVLYVLDEPSIGLHPRDTERLLETLRSLRDLGNTVLVVEHDADTIRAADHVIDMGPGAGKHGGKVLAAASPEELMRMPSSPTGQYLAESAAVKKRKHREPSGVISIRDAHAHNLRHVNVDIPRGVFVCVTGVSGSGKSSLIGDTLLPAAMDFVARRPIGNVLATFDGLDGFERVVSVDQAPIGRTPRSNPATYTGIFTGIRELFSELPESRARGYKASRFSFNVKGGRCEACQGDGVIRIEMHFLPDVFVRCEECHGRRYNRETLDVRYRGLDIAQLLAMPIEEARDLFAAVPRVRSTLESLCRVGLGYVELGQSATTLSGGEAQRIKLARELARTRDVKTLYVLDEPTTGLHFGDTRLLLDVLDDLVDAGHTVIVVEHNLDFIARADYIVDLGPDGGDAGGQLVAVGTPEEVSRNPKSLTGQYLKRSYKFAH